MSKYPFKFVDSVVQIHGESSRGRVHRYAVGVVGQVMCPAGQLVPELVRPVRLPSISAHDVVCVPGTPVLPPGLGVVSRRQVRVIPAVVGSVGGV